MSFEAVGNLERIRSSSKQTQLDSILRYADMALQGLNCIDERDSAPLMSDVRVLQCDCTLVERQLAGHIAAADAVVQVWRP